MSGNQGLLLAMQPRQSERGGPGSIQTPYVIAPSWVERLLRGCVQYAGVRNGV